MRNKIILFMAVLIVPIIIINASENENKAHIKSLKEKLENNFFINEDFYSKEDTFVEYKSIKSFSIYTLVQTFYFDTNGRVVKSVLPIQHEMYTEDSNHKIIKRVFPIRMTSDLIITLKYYYGHYTWDDSVIYLTIDKIKKVKYEKPGDMFSYIKLISTKRIKPIYDTLFLSGYKENKLILKYKNQNYIKEVIEEAGEGTLKYIKKD